jgi:hypothetical protein
MAFNLESLDFFGGNMAAKAAYKAHKVNEYVAKASSVWAFAKGAEIALDGPTATGDVWGGFCFPVGGSTGNPVDIDAAAAANAEAFAAAVESSGVFDEEDVFDGKDSIFGDAEVTYDDGSYIGPGAGNAKAWGDWAFKG